MIPDFTADGLLPPGIYAAAPDEIRERFIWTRRRQQLFQSFSRAGRALQEAGCRRMWLDGSFVTAVDHPEDWDGCWDTRGVDPLLLDPVLRDFSSDGRARVRKKYLCDLLPATFIEKTTGSTFLDYFQVDKQGRPKGIIQINIPGA